MSSEIAFKYRRDFLKVASVGGLSWFLSSCNLTTLENYDAEELSSQIQEYYESRGVRFDVLNTATESKILDVYVAENSGLKVDEKTLRDTYMFFETSNLQTLNYPILGDGNEYKVSLKLTPGKKIKMFVVDYEDGLPEQVIDGLKNYVGAASVYGDKIDGVPSLTFSFPSEQVVVIRSHKGETEDDLYLKGLVEICNSILIFNLKTGYLPENEVSLIEQETLMQDFYCNTLGQAARIKSYKLDFATFKGWIDPLTTTIFVGNKTYGLHYAPITKEDYMLIPTKPFLNRNVNAELK